jgi:hypothetical protein
LPVIGALTIRIDFTPPQHGQLAALLVLVSMLVSFLFIRTSARLMRSPKVPWWPGSVTSGDLHIHHLVFGIVLLMVSGFIEFALRPGEPGLEILAVAFGIGAGLTLDEFALWLHLEDVYWSEEGRQSVDAVVIAALLGSLITMGAFPIRKEDTTSALAIAAVLILVLGIAALAAYKGKYVCAVAGMLMPMISITAAIRLAKPESRWARRRYGEGSDKLARSTERYARLRARYRRVQDLIGGAPTSADEG